VKVIIMGFLDSPACSGCSKKLPPDLSLDGPPANGQIKNIGGTLSPTYICLSCWNEAKEKGFKFESKDEAKRWKEFASLEQDEKRRFILKDAVSERQALLEEAEKQMQAILPPEVANIVEDFLLPNEKIIYKISSLSKLVLTNKNLILINKGVRAGQIQGAENMLGAWETIGKGVAIRIHPISEIRNIEIQPLQGVSMGHFQVLTNATLPNDHESKFLFGSSIGYYQSILLYRKIKQLQSFQMASKMSKGGAPPPPPSSSSSPQKRQ